MSSTSTASAKPKPRVSARKIGAACLAGLFFATVAVAPLAASFSLAAAAPAAAVERAYAGGPARSMSWVGQQPQALQAADAPELKIDTDASDAVEGPAPRPAAQFTLQQFMFSGVVNWGGYKFTYYSQQVLPGGGLKIPGRHVNEGGFVSDAEGFIVLAGSAPLGTVYDTPFGYQGKIYDRGTVGNHLDVYIR